MRKLQILSLLLLMLASSHSMAGTQKGDFEFTGLLYFSNVDTGQSGSNTSGSLISAIGYFYTEQIEFKLSSFVTISSGDTFGSIGPGVDYHFNPESDTIYYAGASYQFDVSDGDAGDRYDLHFGIKRALTERVDLNFQLGLNDSTESDSDFSEKYASLGISYYF